MNQLTPEQLDMIKRLQPFFKEKMGEWQEGDQFYDAEKQRVCVLDEINACWFNAKPIHDEVRIPKPVDWQNPERGLWGMLDWKQWRFHGEFPDGDNFCTSPILMARMTKPFNNIYAQDPETALLKALITQEGL